MTHVGEAIGGPYELHDLILGVLVHMVVIGLPISFSVGRFAKSGDLQNPAICKLGVELRPCGEQSSESPVPFSYSIHRRR